MYSSSPRGVGAYLLLLLLLLLFINIIVVIVVVLKKIDQKKKEGEISKHLNIKKIKKNKKN